MDKVDITFWRSMKVLWSFTWRGFLLSLAIIAPLQIAMGILLFPRLMRAQATGNPGDIASAAAAMTHTMLIVMPCVLIVAAVTQGLAMRWMLRSARWSDFSLALTRKDESSD